MVCSFKQFKNGFPRNLKAKTLFEVIGWKIYRVLHCCSRFLKISLTESPLKLSQKPKFPKF